MKDFTLKIIPWATFNTTKIVPSSQTILFICEFNFSKQLMHTRSPNWIKESVLMGIISNFCAVLKLNTFYAVNL